MVNTILFDRSRKWERFCLSEEIVVVSLTPVASDRVVFICFFVALQCSILWSTANSSQSFQFEVIFIKTNKSKADEHQKCDVDHHITPSNSLWSGSRSRRIVCYRGKVARVSLLLLSLIHLEQESQGMFCFCFTVFLIRCNERQTCCTMH